MVHRKLKLCLRELALALISEPVYLHRPHLSDVQETVLDKIVKPVPCLLVTNFRTRLNIASGTETTLYGIDQGE